MILLYSQPLKKLSAVCSHFRHITIPKCLFSQEIENKYSGEQKEKIIKIINDTGTDISSYKITKTNSKKFSQWRNSNSQISTLSDLELIEGFTKKSLIKLYDSIVDVPEKNQPRTNRIKGQILYPTLTESLRQNCKSVLAVYINVNSVVWTLIDRSKYEVLDWTYYPIDYPDGKKLQITDIYDIALSITQRLPSADVYVMKAEPTSLRAAGSDPSNVKTIAVNLQKAQMIAMIVALINGSGQGVAAQQENGEHQHKVHFLRHSLPFRLYGTLVGNERVSTDQTVELLLQNGADTRARVTDNLKAMFRSQKDLQRDMLGHSLLLALTFMDLCIYKNQESIDKFIQRNGV